MLHDLRGELAEVVDTEVPVNLRDIADLTFSA